MGDKSTDQILLMKQVVGRKASGYVQSGMTIGIGSGSTALQSIVAIGERLVSGDLREVYGVATSYQSAIDAREAGIPLIDVCQVDEIDLTIDGADEVSPGKCLIKGGGAAQVMEKVIAKLSEKFIVIVDSTKISEKIGELAPIPVAVLPQSSKLALKQLAALGGNPKVRMATQKLGPVITDNGNMIIDVWFDQIHEPTSLEGEINLIPGVVDNGLFVDLASLVLVGDLQDGNPVVYEY